MTNNAWGSAMASVPALQKASVITMEGTSLSQSIVGGDNQANNELESSFVNTKLTSKSIVGGDDLENQANNELQSSFVNTELTDEKCLTMDGLDINAGGHINAGVTRVEFLEISKELDMNTQPLNFAFNSDSTLKEQGKTDRKFMVLEKLKRLKSSNNVDHSQVQRGTKPLNENEGRCEVQQGTETLIKDFENASVSEWEIAARQRCIQEQFVLREEREQLLQTLQSLDSSVARTVQKNLELCAGAIAQMRQDSMELKRTLYEARAMVEQLDEVDSLRKRNAVLEHSQAKMASDIELLKIELAHVSEQLKRPLHGNGATMQPADSSKTCVEAMAEKLPCPAVYLLGGHNGDSWLGTVDMLYPLTCQLKPVSSMSAPRSYAAASVLNGHIYVFGGGNGSLWYDTVEVYDKNKNGWTHSQPMKLKRGSLAGATVGDRIFALGGGNGQAHFSEVEFYDAEVGDWLPSVNMLNKRFCVAAAALDGAIYAIGGYDDRKYLKSVERFDPREGLWTMVGFMNRKRGSVSAAVMNGKLYALGGFDGTEFLNSVEVLDPRANCWLEMDERMHTKRAYGTAAVVEGAVYAIGGLDGRSYVDIVERYKEGSGWEILDSAKVGKRCFLAGAVLDTLDVV